MMVVTGITDRLRRENRAGTDMRKMKIEEGERITAVMKEVTVEGRTNVCQKGKAWFSYAVYLPAMTWVVVAG